MDQRPADCYLSNEKFQLKSYQRSSTDDLVARFGSAEKGQTNLDLLKAETQKSFRGGMFQRIFQDPEMASTVQEAYFNKLDSNLYMSLDFTTYAPAGGMNPQGVSAWCVWKDRFVFAAYRLDYAGLGNYIAKYDLTTGAVTIMTPPAAILNASCPITSMVTHKDGIFLCGATINNQTAGTNFNIHRLNPETLAFQDIAGVCIQLYTFRERLYLSTHLNSFFMATNEFAAGSASYDVLKQQVGSSGSAYQKGHVEFNGALYFGKEDGLFRFDGVSIVPVIDYRQNNNPRNFKWMAMFNGRLYYIMGNSLYQFDGVNIELIQDFSEGYRVYHMAAGTDRLWILTQSKNGVPYSDKFGSGTNFDFSLFCFNGTGVFEYKNLGAIPESEFNNPTVHPVGDRVAVIYPNLFLNASLERRTSNVVIKVLFLPNEFTITTIGNSRSAVVISSEMDHGYPAVPKTFNGVQVEYEGLEANKSHIKIEAQYFYDGAWNGSWLEIWNDKNVNALGIKNDYYLHDESRFAVPNITQAPFIYNRVKYKMTISIDAGVTLTTPPRVRSVTARYTLQPRVRRKWLLTLGLFGVDNRGLTSDDETRQANKLRQILYNALENKLPVLFFDADYTKLEYNAGAAKWDLKGQFFCKTGDVIAFKQNNGTWYNARVVATPNAGTDRTRVDIDTSVVGRRVGIGGSNVDVWSTNAEVRRSFAVYVTRISNERYLLSDNTVNDSLGYSDISSDVVVELIEV